MLPYLLSLPERTLRALAAGLGGLLFELSELLLPRALRRTRLYQVLVFRLLRLAVEGLGDVQGLMPPDGMQLGELAARKTVGNAIELLGFLAVGWSPLWLLAAASDLTGGTRAYLNAFVIQLRQDGLLPDDLHVEGVDELLNALENSTAQAADLVDVPPLNVDELRQSWVVLRDQAAGLPSPEQLTILFKDLQSVAGQQGRTLAEVSGLVATGALKTGLQMGSLHVFAYYQEALKALNREGWGVYALRVMRPYLYAGRSHFDPARRTYTERLLRRRNP